MTSPRDHLKEWPRSAYAMEMQAESMLTAHASRLDAFPDLRLGIEQRVAKTLGQQQLLEQCIARYGSGVSAIGDEVGQMEDFGQNVGGTGSPDEIVTGTIAVYALNQKEIACYKTLIAAALTVGDQLTRRACEKILVEEETMASWLAEQLPQAVTQFLLRPSGECESSGSPAKGGLSTSRLRHVTHGGLANETGGAFP